MLLGFITGYAYQKTRFHYATVGFSPIGSISEDHLDVAHRLASDMSMLTIPIICILPILGFILLAIALCCKKPSPTGEICGLVGCLIVGFLVAVVIGIRFRNLPGVNYVAAENRAANQVISRAEQLIDAIEMYENDQGLYPEELEDLVPDYIERIPSTGIAGWSIYGYSTKETHYKMPFDKYQILVGFLFASFDRNDLIYWPDGDYPESHPDFIRRIEDWAYVHHPSSS